MKTWQFAVIVILLGIAFAAFGKEEGTFPMNKPHHENLVIACLEQVDAVDLAQFAQDEAKLEEVATEKFDTIKCGPISGNLIYTAMVFEKKGKTAKEDTRVYKAKWMGMDVFVPMQGWRGIAGVET